MVEKENINSLYAMYFDNKFEVERSRRISYSYVVCSLFCDNLFGYLEIDELEPYIIKKRLKDAIPEDKMQATLKETIVDGLVGDEKYANWRADRIYMPKKLAVGVRKKLQDHFVNKYHRTWLMKFKRIWNERFETKEPDADKLELE